MVSCSSNLVINNLFSTNIAGITTSLSHCNIFSNNIASDNYIDTVFLNSNGNILIGNSWTTARGVQQLTAGKGISLSPSSGEGTVTVTASSDGGVFMISPSTGMMSGTMTDDVKIGTGCFNATGSGDYLKKDNTWATPAGGGIKWSKLLHPASDLKPSGGLSASTTKREYTASGLRWAYVVGDFSGLTNNYLQANFDCDTNYAGGNITAKVIWMSTYTVSGSVVWTLRVQSVADGSNFEGTVWSTYTYTTQANGTAFCTSTNTVSITNITAGSSVKIQIERTSDASGDTIASSIELVGLYLKED